MSLLKGNNCDMGSKMKSQIVGLIVISKVGSCSKIDSVSDIEEKINHLCTVWKGLDVSKVEWNQP